MLSTAKKYHPVRLRSVVSKEMPFILISSLVLGFLSQLQIFRAYSKVFDRVWHAVF